MSRISILTTLFGISVIVLALLVGIFFNGDEYVVPEVSSTALEEISPVVNQSFVEDLEARSSNSVGIDLEL